ncbi:MAG: VOC family protein [Rhodospirillaceae bacterium]|nr:VOC family protein [Rhodospirillaceae bacterium]
MSILTSRSAQHLRSLLCVVALAAGLEGNAALAQDRGVVSPSLAGPLVRRATLVVEDLNKSVDFYQRLGLTKTYDQATTSASEGGVVGADSLPLTEDPKEGRLVVMKGADDRLGMIGLLSYDKPRLASARSNLMGIGTGDVVMVIEVPDVQGVYSRLQQIDVRFHRTPTKYTMTRPDGSVAAGMRMFVYDPDGHLIEVLQPSR